MRNRVAVRWIVIAAVLLLLLLAVWKLLPLPRKANGIPQLQFSQGDALRGHSVYTSDGVEMDIADIAEGPALIIFGMAQCRDCLADLPSYRALYSLYNSEELTVAIVWDDAVPQDRLDELNIPASASYSVRGEYKFTDWVPSYCFVDGSDAITSLTVELGEAIKQLPTVQVMPEDLEQLADGKSVLVGIESCSACHDAYETLAKQGVDFDYFLAGISEITEAHPSNAYADPYSILSRAFGIDTYPVYISLDDTGQLVVDDTI